MINFVSSYFEDPSKGFCLKAKDMKKRKIKQSVSTVGASKDRVNSLSDFVRLENTVRIGLLCFFFTLFNPHNMDIYAFNVCSPT